MGYIWAGPGLQRNLGRHTETGVGTVRTHLLKRSARAPVVPQLFCAYSRLPVAKAEKNTLFRVMLGGKRIGAASNIVFSNGVVGTSAIICVAGSLSPAAFINSSGRLFTSTCCSTASPLPPSLSLMLSCVLYGSDLRALYTQLDPWHGGGVVQNISDTLVSILIPNGAHRECRKSFTGPIACSPLLAPLVSRRDPQNSEMR